MANTKKPFGGRIVVVWENTTTGKYEVDVYAGSVNPNTPVVTVTSLHTSIQFDDSVAGQTAYHATIKQLLSLDTVIV